MFGVPLACDASQQYTGIAVAVVACDVWLLDTYYMFFSSCLSFVLKDLGAIHHCCALPDVIQQGQGVPRHNCD